MSIDWTRTDTSNQFDAGDALKNLAAIGLAQSQGAASDYKLRTQQRQEQTRPLIDARIARGDYTGAQQQALAIGDNEYADRIAKLSDDHVKTVADHADAVASAAYLLRSRPQVQRATTFEQLVPGLKSAGLTDEEIAAGRQDLAQSGWGDDTLSGYVDSHQKVKDLAEQEARNRQQTETERHNRWDENKVSWVTPPAGGYAQGVRSDGTILGQSGNGFTPVIGTSNGNDGAAPPAGPTAASSSTPTAGPLTVRLNNPGALRPDGSQWQGMTGTQGGFVQFDSPANGRRAQIINLQNQARLHGINTLADLTARYAPTADGNNPQAYAATLGRALGIDPHGPIDLADPTIAAHVADAMSRVEAGGSPPQFAQGGSTPSQPTAQLGGGQMQGGRIYGPAKQPEAPAGYRWSADGSRQEVIPGGPADAGGGVGGSSAVGKTAAGDGVDPTIDFLAKTYMQSHQLPPLGMGKQAAAMRQAVFARVAALAAQQGMSAADVGLAGADFKSTGASLSALEKQQAFVSTAEKTTLDNLKIWDRSASALPGQTRYPLVNEAIQFGAKHLGNTDVHPAEDALETVSNEYAKVMSGNASGSGPTSDSARAHARSMLSNADSPQARAKVIQTLTAEMRNRTVELERQRQTLRSRITGGGGSTGSIPPRAIAYLRGNPNSRQAFDAKYGAGSSAHILSW